MEGIGCEGWGPTMGLVTSWETAESSLGPSSVGGHGEKTFSTNQEEGLHQNLTLPLPSPWTSSLWTLRDKRLLPISPHLWCLAGQPPPTQGTSWEEPDAVGAPQVTPFVEGNFPSRGRG